MQHSRVRHGHRWDSRGDDNDARNQRIDIAVALAEAVTSEPRESRKRLLIYYVASATCRRAIEAASAARASFGASSDGRVHLYARRSCRLARRRCVSIIVLDRELVLGFPSDGAEFVVG